MQRVFLVLMALCLSFCVTQVQAATLPANTTVDVGIHMLESGPVTPQGEAVLQGIIANDGVYNSPATITPDNLFKGLSGVAVITRGENDVSPWWAFPDAFPLTTGYASDDPFGIFDGLSFAFTSNVFDGSLTRGFYTGPDGLLWTADDLEVVGDPDPSVDAIVIYGVAVDYADTPENQTYLETHMPFNVYADFNTNAAIGVSNSQASVQVIVPEPGSLALLTAACLVIWTRRSSLR